MASVEPGPDPIGDDARLRSLDERLRAAQVAEQARKRAGEAASDGGYRLGSRILAELLGGLVGGALIGWCIDRLFGTTPWGLIVMLFLGMAVAFRQIVKLASQRPD